jgi:hypothetical protein
MSHIHDTGGCSLSLGCEAAKKAAVADRETHIMIDFAGRLAAVLLGSLLIAIGVTWAVGPVRLLASLVVVPVMWAIVAIVTVGIWVALWLHGAMPL